MTDRELLELAAKAAGIDFEVKPPEWQHPGIRVPTAFGYRWWNPLADDGDALRLAVKLHMFNGGTLLRDQIVTLEVGKRLKFKDHIEEDEYAATRRAIVRAAAEIGSLM